MVNRELAGGFARRLRSAEEEPGGSEVYETKWGLMKLDTAKETKKTNQEQRQRRRQVEQLRSRWANDAVLLGDCDAVAQALAEALGYGPRLEALLAEAAGA